MKKNKLKSIKISMFNLNNLNINVLIKAFLFVFFFNNMMGQKDIVISGGNTVSSMVCANRKVFVWGSNASGQLGLPGTGNVLSPTAMPNTSFGGNDIQQVNSGSGSHFVALDCNGAVWAWGSNTDGQIGNGTSGGVVAVPVKVKADAEIDAMHRDAAGNLINVAVVYAGVSNSFAILSDGKLVSWGKNNYTGGSFCTGCQAGQLGHGTTTSTSVAKYVRANATTTLSGVIQVSAGDNVAYALVDPDGDGVGTVYSWGEGNNGTLGRDAAGTGNPASTTTIQSSFARPVFYGNNTTMNNIKQLQAGDVFGIALDVNGYVWTWGNGGWNNATGNTTINYTGSDPRRVIKGTTTGASNDGTYLLAKAIGGGQGYGMAVTVDGKPVAWGGSGTCADGGVIGTGSVFPGQSPSYIQYGTGLVHNNVTLISRGDTWGFYGTSDNELYAWGCNNFGQLGIGSTVTQTRAVPLTISNTCGLKDPFPYLVLNKKDTTVCSTNFIGIDLNAGFKTNAILDKAYRIQWYKNGSLVKDDPLASFNATTNGVVLSNSFKATTEGKYKVTITYVGANSGCTVYPVISDSITISSFPQTFIAPTNLTYCGDSATVNVNTTATTNPIYMWYPTATSTMPILGTTVGSASSKISLKNITANSNGDKQVYVEEKSYASGSIDLIDCGAPLYNPISIPQYQTRYTAYEPIVLNELTLKLRVTMFNTGVVNMNIKLGVYPATIGNNGLIPLQNAPLSVVTLPVTFSRALNTDPQIQTIAINVPLNITIPGIKSGYDFFISTIDAIQPSGAVVELAASQCRNIPLSDNLPNVDILTQTGMAQNFSIPLTGTSILGGHFYNLKFKGIQKYCDIKPIKIAIKCPCNKPKSIEITSSIVAVNKIITAAFGTQVALKGKYSLSQGDYTSMRYVWFKNGKILSPESLFDVASPYETPSLSLSSIADTGMYVLRVLDKNSNVNNCYLEDSVRVRFSVVTQNKETEIFSNLNVYPNPFEDVLKVALSDKISDFKMIIENIQGQEIVEKTYSNESIIEVDTKHLKSGIYLLKVLFKENVFTYKISK